MLKRNKHSAYKVVKWIVFAIFVLYAISLLAPFSWMLLNTFKSNGEYNAQRMEVR